MDGVFTDMKANLMTMDGPGSVSGTGRAIRILVVDDQAPLRRVMVDVLAEAEDITVVGECDDGDEVVDAVVRTRPDVVLMDVSMERVDGLEATRRLLAVRPRARVLLLTAPSGSNSTEEAQRAGAMGCASKDDILALPAKARVLAAGGTAWI